MRRPGTIDDRRYTVAEYLAMEQKSAAKHDYLDGRVFDMAGGTTNHNSIIVNLIRELSYTLKGTPCRVFSSDQRLRDAGSSLYTYPDVQVVCGEIQYADQDKSRTTITNPRVIFEVLSVSTEAYDRIDKFPRYIALPALNDFVLVSQWSPRVETYHRRDDGTWLFSWVEGLDAVLHVQSIDVHVPLAEVYRDVTFGTAGDGPITQVE